MVLGAVLFLGFVSLRAFQLRHAHPWLTIGWLWFLGTLVPVIGIMQVGSQAMADRYTYIPSIGLFIMIVWGVDRLTSQWPRRTAFLSFAGVIVLAACLAFTGIQVRLWKNSEVLFRHALETAPNNGIAHAALAEYLQINNQTDEAIDEY